MIQELYRKKTDAEQTGNSSVIKFGAADPNDPSFKGYAPKKKKKIANPEESKIKKEM